MMVRLLKGTSAEVAALVPVAMMVLAASYSDWLREPTTRM